MPQLGFATANARTPDFQSLLDPVCEEDCVYRVSRSPENQQTQPTRAILTRRERIHFYLQLHVDEILINFQGSHSSGGLSRFSESFSGLLVLPVKFCERDLANCCGGEDLESRHDFVDESKKIIDRPVDFAPHYASLKNRVNK